MSKNTAPSFSANLAAQGITIIQSEVYARGNTITVQPDGKILLGGTNHSPTTEYTDFALLRYNPDGSLDTRFSGDGLVTTSYGYRLNSDGQSIAVQADGKILLAGNSSSDRNPTHDFFLARYNADGSLDRHFSGDGLVTLNVGYASYGSDVTLQADGKILLGGSSINAKTHNLEFALVRYNPNGSLDTSFSGDGSVTTGIGTDASGNTVTVQANGKILLGGTSTNPKTQQNEFTLMRYNPNGSLDKGFSGDGIVTTHLGNWSSAGSSVTVQADSNILLGGTSTNPKTDQHEFTLVRYNPNGSLDSHFSQDGIVTTHLANRSFEGNSVTVQADGKILLGGTSTNPKTDQQEFILVRYNADGSLDKGFSGDGMVTTHLGNTSFEGNSVTVQADGKILLGGTSTDPKTYRSDFTVVRYNPDGSLDTRFGGKSSLDNTAVYAGKGQPVVLDSNARIFDADLNKQGHYGGASISLHRHGGINSEDVFSAAGKLSFVGHNAWLSGVVIGTVSQSAGKLTLVFNNNASQARVDAALSSIAYHNTQHKTAAEVAIDWTFNDGNRGAQGTGGAMAITGSTTVVVNGPVTKAPIVLNMADTVYYDDFGATDKLHVDTAGHNSRFTYGLVNGKLASDGISAAKGAYGTLNLNTSSGRWEFVPDGDALNVLNSSVSIHFTMTAYSNKQLAFTLPLDINISQQGKTETNGNDNLVGTAKDGVMHSYVMNGYKGDDIINGGGGANFLYGGLGNDTLIGGVGYDDLSGNEGNDSLNGKDGDDALRGWEGNDILNGGDGEDFLNGNEGNDTLYGGEGNDDLYGGTGNDRLNGQNGNDSLDGSDGKDTLYGDAGKDNLDGGQGNDLLNGGDGNDVLTGGVGKDSFVFKSGLNRTGIDTLTDFKPIDDTIVLSKLVYTSLGAPGTLSAANFVVGTHALDNNDFLIYNKTTGALFYDDDGSGAHAALQIATLGVKLAVSHLDFVVT
jgi:serralysin